MTVLHMVNCTLTAFAPHGVLLWALNEVASPWRLMATGGAFFLAAQITKILLLVVLPFPTGDETFHATWELFKCTTNMVDVFAVFLLLRTRLAMNLDDKHRVLISALGWAMVESVASNFLPFFIGARTAEFSWEYTLRAVLSNFHLVAHIIFTGFVFLWTRARGEVENRSLLALSGVIHLVALPMLASYEKAEDLNADATFMLFCVRAGLLAVSAIFVKQAYVSSWNNKKKIR
eukprot:Selendium_serpulae@DN5710_c0_g1_i1.p2